MSFASVLRDYWTTMRPYLLFVTGAAALAGLSLQQGELGPRHAIAFAALFFSYGLGQALTDLTQLDTDRLSAPYRPLVRGTLGRGTVLVVTVAGLCAVAIALAALNPWTLAPVSMASLGLASYTWFKRRYWGGPFWNSWIVALVPVIAIMAGGDSASAAVRDPLVVATLVSVFSGYAVFVILGYLKDVDADRATGYETIPVRFGRETAVAASAPMGVVAVTAAGVVALRARPPLEGAALVAGLLLLTGAAAMVRAHLRCGRSRTDFEAHSGIADSVRAFVMTHAGLAALSRPELLAPALVLVALFEVALARRPEESQI